MEKSYRISEELYEKIRALLSALTLPHMHDEIKHVNAHIARDIIEVKMSVDQVWTRRILNDLMRAAYAKGETDKVINIREIKNNLSQHEEGAQ